MARSLLNWKKTQTRNLTVFMMLVILPSSTLKFFFLFAFDFNYCLSNLFLKGSPTDNFHHDTASLSVPLFLVV